MDLKTVTELRAMTGAGIVDCKNALVACEGDLQKAADELRKKGLVKAAKKGTRATKEGLVQSYLHPTGKLGVLVEVQCETDFVARTEQFQQLVHDIAMHIAAACPLYITSDEVPAEMVEKEKEIVMAEFDGSSKPQEVIAKIAEGKMAKYYEEICLMNQRFVKDEDLTIEAYVKGKIATIGENIRVTRFVRFNLEGTSAAEESAE